MPRLAEMPLRGATLQGLPQHIHHVIAGREIEAQRGGQENQQDPWN